MSIFISKQELQTNNNVLARPKSVVPAAIFISESDEPLRLQVAPHIIAAFSDRLPTDNPIYSMPQMPYMSCRMVRFNICQSCVWGYSGFDTYVEVSPSPKAESESDSRAL